MEATRDALLVFSLELMDGVPQAGEWLERLRFLERRGHIGLDEYDLDNPLDLEYLYKKHVAMGDENDWMLLNTTGRVTPEEVARAEDSFRGDAPRDADNTAPPAEQG